MSKMKYYEILWRLPLAILSFFFNRLSRLVVLIAMLFHSVIKKKEGELRWVGMSELLSRKLMFSYVMLFAPRWNCGGNIAFLGLVAVNEKITIHWDYEAKGNGTWIVEVFRGRKKITTILSSHIDRKTSVFHLQVIPGQYRLVYRGYGFSDDASYPTIRFDEQQHMVTADVKKEQVSYNNMLTKLCGSEPAVYRVLHYYTHFMMMLNHPSLEGFLRQEYLPAANTETHFEFGGLRKGQTLKLSVDKYLQEDFYVNIVYLNKASFPVHWQYVTNRDTGLPMAKVDGTYLVRAIPKYTELDKSMKLKVTAGLAISVF